MLANRDRLPYFKFFTVDMTIRTKHLSIAAHGGFMRLITCQWEGGPLPKDLAVLKRMVPGLTKALWEEIHPLFEDRPEGFVHAPLEDLRNDVAEDANRRTQHASKAAKSRWDNHRRSCALSNARALPEHCPNDAIQNQNQKQDPPAPRGLDGWGGSDSPQESSQQTPTLSLVRTLHCTADVALARLIRVRGEQEGRGDFEGIVETRLRQASRRFTDLGCPDDEAHTLAERTLTAWPWDDWSTQLGNIVTQAKTKDVPAGWLRWRLTENPTETEQRAATA